MTSNPVVLEMKMITKTFPGVKALDNVSFKAHKGEILSLVGENGAGKSTLMKVLSGSYPHTSYTGDIYIDGKLQKFQNPAQAEEAGIAMIYQEISMHLDMSIMENIFLGRWPTKNGRVQWGEMERESRRYLEMVHLDVDPHDTLRKMGASQQQLVSIARALSKNPKLFILDEPTSPLTKDESDRLFRILHELKKSGTAIILISHKLDEVFDNSDRITVLRDGKTISSNRIEDIQRDKVITEMVGREITSYYPKETTKIGQVVLEANNIVVKSEYSANNIVRGISFNVRSGEILGIAGLVGAGRSEMVEAIFGKRPLRSGEVLIDGKKVNIKSPADAIRNGLALVTEERKTDGIIGIHSIKENAILVAMRTLFPNGIINPTVAEKKTREYFDKMRVKAPGTDTLVQQLSGGNQQKVVLEKWLMNHPRILIMDEPTRGIDVGARSEIYKIMVDLAKQGIAIIMISSDLPEVINMSDRIIVVGEGKLRGELNAEEATQEKIMTYAMTAE